MTNITEKVVPWIFVVIGDGHHPLILGPFCLNNVFPWNLIFERSAFQQWSMVGVLHYLYISEYLAMIIVAIHSYYL